MHIQSIVHRKRKVWLVTFPFDSELYHKCKTNGGRYTQTYKGWWWPTDEIRKNALRERLLGIPDVAHKSVPKIKRASPHTNISDPVLIKIRKMEVWMVQKRYSASTIKTYLSFVRQFFSVRPDLHWNTIRVEDINQYNFENFIFGNKSNRTQNQWINAIKIYLRVNGLDIGDLTDIERPRKSYSLPNVLTKEEVRKILVSTRNQKHKFLLSIIYGAGLRVGEALRLRKFDIRPTEKLIYIRRSKGNKDRRVPLSIALNKLYIDYCAGFQPQNYVFEGQGGGQYSPSSARKVLKRACNAAGINLKMTEQNPKDQRS